MKVVKKTLDPSIIAFEREAFFKASLRLIKEGRFKLAPMDEIAFRARISGLATPFIFESKENLFSDLVKNVTSQIAKVITNELSKSGSFKQKFFALWLGLYEYYSKHPGVVSFIEQKETLCQSSSVNVCRDVFELLIDFFRTANGEFSNDISSETLASVYHENVLSAVKLTSNAGPASEHLRLKLLPLLLWETYACAESTSQDVLNH